MPPSYRWFVHGNSVRPGHYHPAFSPGGPDSRRPRHLVHTHQPGRHRLGSLADLFPLSLPAAVSGFWPGANFMATSKPAAWATAASITSPSMSWRACAALSQNSPANPSASASCRIWRSHLSARAIGAVCSSTGAETFAAIFKAIENARHYILVQFFIVRDDRIGRGFAGSRLMERAKAGVQVFFLYDEIGSIRLPKKYLTALAAGGSVRIQPFNTCRGWRNFASRSISAMHRIAKLSWSTASMPTSAATTSASNTLAKARASATGATPTSKSPVPPSPACKGLSWKTGPGRRTKSSNCPSPSPSGDIPAPSPTPTADDTAEHLGHALVIPSGPADPVNTCTLMFLALISSAKKRLWITSPYFVPDETVYDALQLAALRGVDVRIMLPAKPDHILVYLASFSYFESAEQIGVKFYRYRAGFLHQKVMLVDDELGVVGTANLDNRSMRLNFGGDHRHFRRPRLQSHRLGNASNGDFEKCERCHARRCPASRPVVSHCRANLPPAVPPYSKFSTLRPHGTPIALLSSVVFHRRLCHDPSLASPLYLWRHWPRSPFCSQPHANPPATTGSASNDVDNGTLNQANIVPANGDAVATAIPVPRGQPCSIPRCHHHLPSPMIPAISSPIPAPPASGHNINSALPLATTTGGRDTSRSARTGSFFFAQKLNP